MEPRDHYEFVDMFRRMQPCYEPVRRKVPSRRLVEDFESDMNEIHPYIPRNPQRFASHAAGCTVDRHPTQGARVRRLLHCPMLSAYRNASCAKGFHCLSRLGSRG